MQAEDVHGNISTYCPVCNCEVEADVFDHESSQVVRGEVVNYNEQLAICPVCCNAIGDSRVESVNLKRLYAEYRRLHNMLTPEEIKDLRESYGLSLREFSRFLGFGEQTVARYERGALQDNAHDMVIRSASTSDGAAALLDRNGSLISDASRIRVERRISMGFVGENDPWKRPVLPAEPLCVTDVPSPSNGFMATSMERVKELISILSINCKNLFVTKLQKVLFFCDFSSYETYGRSLTGLSYAHADQGPIVNNYKDMIDELVRDGSIHLEDNVGGRGKIVVADTAPTGIFSEDDINLIIRVAKFANTFPTAAAISNYSHELACWLNTENGNIIKYTTSNNEVVTSVNEKIRAVEAATGISYSRWPD